jgi:hypothetical protein
VSFKVPHVFLCCFKKGGSFPKNYRPADPGPPIDNYQAPFREPKLPPAGLEIGGAPIEQEPPEFYPENPPPGKDMFGNPVDPLAQPNATEYNLCPIDGPCQPLLFPPLVGNWTQYFSNPTDLIIVIHTPNSTWHKW